MAEDHKLPALIVSQEQAQKYIQDQIDDANHHLLQYEPYLLDPNDNLSAEEKRKLEQQKQEMLRPRLAKWSKHTKDVLLKIFDDTRIADEFTNNGMRSPIPTGGASLRELVDYMQEDVEVLLSIRERLVLFPVAELLINNILGSPSDAPQYQCDVFVIMPFTDPFNSIYQDHIKPIAEKHDLVVKRGDDPFSPRAIMNDVWSAIYASSIVIAECTGRNLNVFYELGMAHALAKPSILLTQNIRDIPFDIQHLRHIQYESTPHGMEVFDQKLKTAIAQLMVEKEI